MRMRHHQLSLGLHQMRSWQTDRASKYSPLIAALSFPSYES
jgi:hypothetical protein